MKRTTTGAIVIAIVASLALAGTALAGSKTIRQTGQIVGDSATSVKLRVKVKNGDAKKVSGYKAKKVANAEGEADRFSKLLAEYERAPAVTRERLYIETIERVLKSSRKVFLDTKGDGSNLVYLPIDKLLEQGRRVQRAEPEATVTIEGTTTTSSPDVSDRRSRGTR